MISQTRARRLAGSAVLGVCVALIGVGVASAEPTKCRHAILKASAKLARETFAAVSNCRDRHLKAGESIERCDRDVKVVATVAKGRSKLHATIARACGGTDKACGSGSDEILSAVGWDIAACPDVERIGCSAPIASCTDIANCLDCGIGAPIERTLSFYYDPFASPNAVTTKDVRSCRRAIGKETAKLYGALSKSREQCWASLNAGKAGFVGSCPSADASGKTVARIAQAIDHHQQKICKACGGKDKRCGTADDLAVDVIGFPTSCPLVRVPDEQRACGATVGTVSAVATCAECLVRYELACLDALSLPSFVQPFPPECLARCGDGQREGLEICDGLDDEACAAGCTADCTCVVATPTPKLTTTIAATPRPPTPTGSATNANPTPTIPSPAASTIRTTSPTATVPTPSAVGIPTATPTVGKVIPFDPGQPTKPADLGLPQDPDGSFPFLESGNFRFALDPEARAPIAVLIGCTWWINRCFEPNLRSYDDCARSAPRCQTARPWEEPVCCPEACFAAYAGLRSQGTEPFDAFMAAFIDHDSCYPGVPPDDDEASLP